MEHRPKLYYHIPQHVLDWEWRKRRLMIEFGLWNPDILCLQEVDKFHDIEAELAARGYTGIWKMRTGTAVDGCAIFWRTNRFHLRSEEDIEFSKLGLRDNVAQVCVLESKTENPFESASAPLPSSSDQPKGANQIIICNIHVLYNPKRGEIKLGQVRVLLERAYAVSRDWNDAPVILCGDFNSTPRSPLYNFIAEQKLSLSGLARDQVSGQYAASNYTPRPYTSSGLYRPQPRVYKPSDVASGSEQGKFNLRTDSTHQCEIGNASFTEKVPLSKRPIGELHTDSQSSPVIQCITGDDTTSDAIANEKGEIVTQDDECSESISTRNTFVPKSTEIVEISHELNGSFLNMGNGGTESSPSISCSDAFEEVVVANTAPAAAKEITSDKMSMKTFPDIVEVSSIDGVPSSDLITEQEDHLVISYKETSESSPDNFLIISPPDTKSVDLCVNELSKMTVKDSCPHIDDGTTNSSRNTLRHVGGVVSLHYNGQPDYSAQSNSDISCQYQEKSTAYGVQNSQFDDPISPSQGDNERTDLCHSEENSDPNFFKELLGTEDAYDFREEAGVGMLNSASLHQSTSTSSGTQAKEESSTLVGPHYAGQEENSYTPYNPYLWTPMEIEAASGKAECPFVEHNLKLRSAYTDVEDSEGTKDSGREPQVTSYNRQFMGTVDYIWYSEGLQTDKVLDTIPKHILQRTPGFPTQKWGSDHIALACQFSITKG